MAQFVKLNGCALSAPRWPMVSHGSHDDLTEALRAPHTSKRTRSSDVSAELLHGGKDEDREAKLRRQQMLNKAAQHRYRQRRKERQASIESSLGLMQEENTALQMHVMALHAALINNPVQLQPQQLPMVAMPVAVQLPLPQPQPQQVVTAIAPAGLPSPVVQPPLPQPQQVVAAVAPAAVAPAALTAAPLVTATSAGDCAWAPEQASVAHAASEGPPPGAAAAHLHAAPSQALLLAQTKQQHRDLGADCGAISTGTCRSRAPTDSQPTDSIFDGGSGASGSGGSFTVALAAAAPGCGPPFRQQGDWAAALCEFADRHELVQLLKSGGALDPGPADALRRLVLSAAEGCAAALDASSPDAPRVPGMARPAAPAEDEKERWLQAVARMELSGGQMQQLLDLRGQLLRNLSRCLEERAAIASSLVIDAGPSVSSGATPNFAGLPAAANAAAGPAAAALARVGYLGGAFLSSLAARDAALQLQAGLAAEGAAVRNFTSRVMCEAMRPEQVAVMFQQKPHTTDVLALTNVLSELWEMVVRLESLCNPGGDACQERLAASVTAAAAAAGAAITKKRGGAASRSRTPWPPDAAPIGRSESMTDCATGRAAAPRGCLSAGDANGVPSPWLAALPPAPGGSALGRQNQDDALGGQTQDGGFDQFLRDLGGAPGEDGDDDLWPAAAGGCELAAGGDACAWLPAPLMGCGGGGGGGAEGAACLSAKEADELLSSFDDAPVLF